MAEAIGATPVRLAPGSKAAYHAAAVLAAGGFIALLDAIAELGRVAGLDEAGSLAVYGPLIEGTLGNARALGIRAALTGPMTRGDVGTLQAHLAALQAHAPGVLELYVAAAKREIDLASERGALAPETAATMRTALTTALARPQLTRYHCRPWDTASPPSTRLGRRPDSCVRPVGRASAGSDSVPCRPFPRLGPGPPSSTVPR